MNPSKIFFTIFVALYFIIRHYIILHYTPSTQKYTQVNNKIEVIMLKTFK